MISNQGFLNKIQHCCRTKSVNPWALGITTLGFGALCIVLYGIGRPARESMPVPTPNDAFARTHQITNIVVRPAATVFNGAASLPEITAPVSTSLRIVADRTQTNELRLKPLVDGTVTALTPSDILLLRRILRDVSEEDTIRNEAANHLRANQVSDLADDCLVVLAHASERPRFRSFAAQHLGIAWVDACNQKSTENATVLQPRLIALLTDRDVEVRRESLLALVRGGNATGLAEAARLLASDDTSDTSVTAMRDLALRIAGETRQVTSIPRVRLFLHHSDSTVRAAAILALGKLGDKESRAAIVAATSEKNLMIAGAAKSALEAIDQNPVEPAKSATQETAL